MIKVYKDENVQYKCTAPKEYRVNIYPQARQWVVDFTICDTITTEKINELLETTSLTFVTYNDETGEIVGSVTLNGYTSINTVSITYNQDLSRTAMIQLGKEVERNVIKV